MWQLNLMPQARQMVARGMATQPSKDSSASNNNTAVDENEEEPEEEENLEEFDEAEVDFEAKDFEPSVAELTKEDLDDRNLDPELAEVDFNDPDSLQAFLESTGSGVYVEDVMDPLEDDGLELTAEEEAKLAEAKPEEINLGPNEEEAQEEYGLTRSDLDALAQGVDRLTGVRVSPDTGEPLIPVDENLKLSALEEEEDDMMVEVFEDPLPPRSTFSDLMEFWQISRTRGQSNKQLVDIFRDLITELKGAYGEQAPSAEDVDKLSPEDPLYHRIFRTEYFNMCLEVMLESERFQGVKDLVLLMHLKGIKPDLLTWTIYVDAFKRSGTMEEIEDFTHLLDFIDIEMTLQERRDVLNKISTGEISPEEEAEIAQAVEELAEYDNKVFAPERTPERVPEDLLKEGSHQHQQKDHHHHH